MHFGTKSYLKSNRYRTVKHTMQKGKMGVLFFSENLFSFVIFCMMGHKNEERLCYWKRDKREDIFVRKYMHKLT